jgi:hypothetical protein
VADESRPSGGSLDKGPHIRSRILKRAIRPTGPIGTIDHEIEAGHRALEEPNVPSPAFRFFSFFIRPRT